MSSPQNFKYLDDLIHSDTEEIILDCDIVLEGMEEYSYYEGISLDVDDLVIDGNGHYFQLHGFKYYNPQHHIEKRL